MLSRYGFVVYRLGRKLYIPLLLMVLISACSGLTGEPQIVATLPPRPTPLPETGFPAKPPDLAVGAQIFAARCIRCHGTSGRGDGELVLAGQIAQPRDFTDPATTSNQTPKAWFDIITNGRLENGMPPWNEALNQEQRWAVSLYTYTMSYQTEQLTAGRLLWESNKAVADAVSAITGNLQDQAKLVGLSDDALLKAVTDSGGGSLDDNQRRAVVTYARSLSLANAQMIDQTIQPAATSEVPAPAGTQEAAAASITGTVTGRITNATAGGQIPADAAITLHIVDEQFNDLPMETKANPDGTFIFNNVELRPDRNYIATLSYQNRTFVSDFVQGSTTIATLDLPIEIYDLTDDPSVIRIVGIVTQMTPASGSLQVAQIMRFQNTSDRLFSTNEDMGGGRFASVRVSIPPNARLMGFSDDQQRYVFEAEQALVIDTAAVAPGEEHLIHVIYSLPYNGGMTIEQPVHYALQGPVRILMDMGAPEIISDQLPAIGPEVVGNRTYSTYGANLTLSAADVIRYELRGTLSSPQTSTTTTSNTISPNTLLVVALFVAGIGAIVLGLAIYWRGRTTDSGSRGQQQLIDGLIRQIAELDESREAGKINKKAYEKQRSILKARLAELIEEDQKDSDQ